MNKSKQKVTIALACGYKNVGSTGFANPNWKSWEEPTGKRVASLPDYPNDLNAMHEAEKAITMHPDFEYKYGETLARATIGKEFEDEGFAPNGWGYFSVLRATAAQRAEAFLKTLGLWEDDIGANDQMSGGEARHETKGEI